MFHLLKVSVDFNALSFGTNVSDLGWPWKAETSLLEKLTKFIRTLIIKFFVDAFNLASTKNFMIRVLINFVYFCKSDVSAFQGHPRSLICWYQMKVRWSQQRLWADGTWVKMSSSCAVWVSASLYAVFTARCTIVQNAVLRLHVVCPSTVTLMDQDHIGWKSLKLTARTFRFATPTQDFNRYYPRNGYTYEIQILCAHS